MKTSKHHVFGINKITLVFAVMAVGGSVLHATIKTFTGASNARWSVSGNWNPAGAPVAGDDLVFATTNRTQANADLTNNINSITFTNFYTLGVQAVTAKVFLGAGGIVVEPQVTGGTCLYRMLTYLDGNRTIINNSTNSLLNFNLATDFTTLGQYLGIDNQGFLLTMGGAGNITFQTSFTIIGSGGLTKTGTGTLTLNSTNTYTGPTTVAEGRLVLCANQIGGGAVIVSNQATFAPFVIAPGATFRCSSLTLGQAPAGSVTNDFTLGSLGNPTVPVVYATNLMTTGTVYVNVTGGGLVVGQFTLLKYGTLGGDGFTFVTNSLPGGVSGYLSNNIANSSLDLVVTDVPSLRWSGNTNGVTLGNWDVNGTSNWVDFVTGVPAYFVNGISVNFDDTAATNVVTLTTNVAPFDVNVTTASTYTFTNSASTNRLTGSARITKEGSGTLVLGMSTNSYTGSTKVNAGVLRIAANQAIGSVSAVTADGTVDLAGFNQTIGSLSGSGTVTNSVGGTNTLTITTGGGSTTFSGQIFEGAGRLTLSKAGASLQKISGNNQYSGGTFISTLNGLLQIGGDNVLGSGPVVTTSSGGLSPDSSPRLLTNDFYFNGQTTFGSVGAGLLTLSGNIYFTNSSTGDRAITCNSDVIWSGTTISSLTPDTGFGDKQGTGTLTLKNISGTLQALNPTAITDGAMILDGAALTLATSGLRVKSAITNGLGLLVITNGGSLTLSASNLRIGDTGSGTLASTNRVDVVGGTLTIAAGSLNMGYESLRSILNARDGAVIQVNTINLGASGGPPSTSEINFDNATLKPTVGTGNFFSSIQEVYIHNGGLTIDTPFNITVAQNFLTGTGSGGLTKKGIGRLTLSGTSSYTGATVGEVGGLRINGTLGSGAVNIKSGAFLAGIGTIGGQVTVEPGASLEPGQDNIGTLTINNNLLLQGTTVMELNRDLIPNSDQVVSTGTIAYGGALTVTNIGTTLQAGDIFQLFSGPIFSGSFTNVSLPTTYVWTNKLAFNGTIEVLSVVQPAMTHSINGTSLNLTWPEAYLGWVLESQTNSLDVGITSTWFPVSGSESVTSIDFTIEGGNPTVFYRLRSP